MEQRQLMTVNHVSLVTYALTAQYRLNHVPLVISVHEGDSLLRFHVHQVLSMEVPEPVILQNVAHARPETFAVIKQKLYGHPRQVLLMIALVVVLSHSNVQQVPFNAIKDSLRATIVLLVNVAQLQDWRILMRIAPMGHSVHLGQVQMVKNVHPELTQTTQMQLHLMIA